MSKPIFYNHAELSDLERISRQAEGELTDVMHRLRSNARPEQWHGDAQQQFEVVIQQCLGEIQSLGEGQAALGRGVRQADDGMREADRQGRGILEV